MTATVSVSDAGPWVMTKRVQDAGIAVALATGVAVALALLAYLRFRTL